MGVESVRIPRIEIHGVHDEVTRPTRDNPEGSILSKLRSAYDTTTEQIVVASHPHLLINISPPVPHHPNGSDVLWHAASDGNHQIEQWDNPGGWHKLAQNKNYLDAVQNHALEETTRGKSVYFMFGWSPYNPSPEPGFMRQAAQTQIRPHEHIRDALTGIPSTGYITLQNATQEELRMLAVIMDFGSPLIRERFPEINDFSSRTQTWEQFGGETIRYAYGFLNLTDVVLQLVYLHTRLHPDWKSNIRKLYEARNNDYLVNTPHGKQSFLLFPPGFCASAFFPNSEDRKIMGVKPDDPHVVWVSLGTPLSKTTTVDGVWLDRK